MISAIGLMAQEKKLSIEEATYMSRSVYPESLSQVQWMGNSDKFVYVKNNKIVVGKANSSKRDTLFWN